MKIWGLMTGGGKIPCCKNDAVTVEGLGNQGVRTMKHSKIKIKGHEDAGYWNSCEVWLGENMKPVVFLLCVDSPHSPHT